MLQNLPCVGEDPEYQRIKQELRSQSNHQLEGILKETTPLVSRRKRNMLIISGLATAIPLAGLAAAAILDSFGLREIANTIGNYAGLTLLGELPFVFGYSMFIATGKRKREEYNAIAAEVILNEKR